MKTKIKTNTPFNINTKIPPPRSKRDFHDPGEAQKPNSAKYREGWQRIFERKIDNDKSR